MEQTKNRLFLLEVLLSLLFITIWGGIASGRLRGNNHAWSYLKEKMKIDDTILKTTGISLIKNAQAELVPILTGTENTSNSKIILPVLKELIQKETFPVQRYSMDYWTSTDSYEAKYSDQVPDYFRESDETNEEPKKSDPGIMPTTGTGKSYSLKALSDRDFLLKNFYIVDETTSMSSEETDGAKLAQTDLSLDLSGENLSGENLSEGSSKDSPLVLIYHTHGSESYRKEDGKTGTVVDAGNVLAKELEEKYHIGVIHDTTIYDMINGELDRSLAYNYAGDSVASLLEKNPGIQVVIDLHRDSISEHHHLATEINGKQTAQVMFFNGVSRRSGTGDIDYLYNPNKLDNLAFSLQMQLLAAKYFPGYTRKIYIKGYRYNLHLKKRAMLVEVGAQNNTLSEAENAMAPLAELLYRLLSGEKCYEKK